MELEALDLATTDSAAEPDGRLTALATLERALTTPELADRMELALWSPAPDTYRAAAVDGSVLFRRVEDGGRWRFDELEVTGRNPLADQATDRFLGLDAERQHRFPTGSTTPIPTPTTGSPSSSMAPTHPTFWPPTPAPTRSTTTSANTARSAPSRDGHR
ncbi:MAG: hypothetical protein IPF42_07240 [Candidatus Microthrix sp.]|nr:hypothetical protein [Candidatus Microthrix sp.]